jgi:lipid-A-disaccharide synthase
VSESEKDQPVEVLIVAAEPSSALYAQRLLEHWKKSGLKVKAFGIGSREMEALGFERLGKSEELAIVGLVEVIKHYPEIKSVFDSLISEASRRRPKAVLLLDYPDFNLRLAKKLKGLGLKVFYYISPTVWAWRKSRIKIIQKYVDKMLVLLPFEKDFYKENGVDVEFVGHPILDELSPALFDRAEINRGRSRYGVTAGEVWVGLKPGSRRSELKYHLDLQLKVAERMYAADRSLKFALLVAPNFSVDEMKKRLPQYDLPLTIMQDEPFKMVSLMDLVLCASGTATLVVGLMGKPMVIMYKVNAMTAFMLRFVIRADQTFGLINLILGRRVALELFQGAASEDRLFAEMLKLAQSSELRDQLSKELMEVHQKLGQKGATVRVASVLQPYLN